MDKIVQKKKFNISNDPRTKKTKRLFKEAFLSQLNKKDISKITVTSLCKQCECNRSTFYKYYNDIYDLLEEIEKEFLNQTTMFANDIKNDENSSSNIIQSVLTYIYENRRLLSLFILKEKDHYLMHKLDVLVRDLYSVKLKQLYIIPSSISDKEFDDFILFLANGYYAIYKRWLQNNCKESILYIATMTNSLALACTDKLFIKK